MSNANYDPVYAHEYYEKHKKLKGRSTKGMSQAKKAQWAYAKSLINSNYSAKGKALTEASKNQRSALSKQAQAKIKVIRSLMKGMSTEQKQALKEAIVGIKATLKASKQQVTDVTKATRASNKVQKEADLDTAYARIKG